MRQGTAEFIKVDVEDESSLAAAMAGADLVVHMAGPFQLAEPKVQQRQGLTTKP